MVRLDKRLVEIGVASSREDAAQLVESGFVSVGGVPAVKPSTLVAPDAVIVAEPRGDRWVSRGAYKLLKALDSFGVDVSGLDCVDIGASTGGFTQVLLSRGAARVAAVDVGYGQLAWALRNDPRVVVVERTNARNITPEDYGGWRAGIVTVDASFISLRTLLPAIEGVLSLDGRVVALVKPQFEVGRERVGKGVVRDPDLHAAVLAELEQFIARSTGLSIYNATWSPIKGPEGNIAFIFLLGRDRKSAFSRDWVELVESAHAEFSRMTGGNSGNDGRG